VGNRETMVTGAGTTQYAYDAADRLTSVTPPGAGAVSYTFDDNGNLTDRGSDDFAWDAEDRLTSATVNSVTTTFTYNGDGLRDSLTLNSNTTTFTWDVNRSIPQVLDDEALRYIYGIGRIAQVDGADTYYYLSDGLGSTMALTDEDGDVVNDYDYDVFGALRDSSGSQDNDFTFAGEQVDGSTGLQYLQTRYYEVETGRFISRDTIKIPYPWNHPFGYANSNPALLVDPKGTVPPAPGETCRLTEGDEPSRCDGGIPSCDPDCGFHDQYEDIASFILEQIAQEALQQAVEQLNKLLLKQVELVARLCTTPLGSKICFKIVPAIAPTVEEFVNPDDLSDSSCTPENDCYPFSQDIGGPFDGGWWRRYSKEGGF